MNNKIDKDDMEKALIKHKDMITEETYSSKFKNKKWSGPTP